MLFVIVMEALSRLIDKAIGAGMLSGFSVGGVDSFPLEISHLQFAEDTLIFCEADSDQPFHLRSILVWFEATLGLWVNLGKSELVQVGDVPFLEELADILGCKTMTLPMKYLGQPLGAKFKLKDIWTPIVEKMERRLQPLKLAYPELYHIACNKEAVVADFVHFRAKIKRYEQDKMCWQPSPSTGFQVKSFYKQISSTGAGSFPWNNIWKAKVPPMVAFFSWTAASGKILTLDNLRRHGIILASWCCMCKADGESIDHLLLHCPYAKELWDMIFVLFGIHWVMPKQVIEVLLLAREYGETPESCDLEGHSTLLDVVYLERA
uniref:Reverse transcriptase zinc-binding domain-containing protein n=1 Tax=Fagus sylvatica TaxID=28930 RepID=A0A2N9F8F9_FAGSY